MSTCIFCQIIAGEAPSHKIYEDEKVLAFLDTKPLNPGQTVVVPKKHAEHLLESTDEEITSLILAAKKIAPVVMQSVGAQGCNINFNVGHSAGQVIFHTHLNLIPRYDDDGYKEWCRIDEVKDNLLDVSERIRDGLEKVNG